MTELRLRPTTQPLRGALRVPADKSITHRALMLAPLLEGASAIENYLDSETTRATLNIMRQLGADITAVAPDTLKVNGGGLRSLREAREILYCLGSGTTTRLLAGLVAGQPFLSVLDGTPALKRRPMGRIVEPLRQMGAEILARDGDRYLPMAVRGGALRGIRYALPVASAQVKSAILLAALYADSATIVLEPTATRDHTERMLRALGVELSQPSENAIQLQPLARLPAREARFVIPGDMSSAAFFIVAALLVGDSELRLENVGLNPGRTGLLDVLARMADPVGGGRPFDTSAERDENGEPVGELRVRSATLRGTTIGGSEIPRLIDEFPILAVAATQAEGETRVCDAAELRLKESDRVATVAHELRQMGAQIEEQPDGFIVSGPTPLKGARVNAHNDHRLAMSLAVAALVAQGETVIEGWECTADSFPNFGALLYAAVGQSVRVG